MTIKKEHTNWTSWSPILILRYDLALKWQSIYKMKRALLIVISVKQVFQSM